MSLNNISHNHDGQSPLLRSEADKSEVFENKQDIDTKGTEPALNQLSQLSKVLSEFNHSNALISKSLSNSETIEISATEINSLPKKKLTPEEIKQLMAELDEEDEGLSEDEEALIEEELEEVEGRDQSLEEEKALTQEEEASIEEREVNIEAEEVDLAGIMEIENKFIDALNSNNFNNIFVVGDKGNLIKPQTEKVEEKQWLHNAKKEGKAIAFIDPKTGGLIAEVPTGFKKGDIVRITDLNGNIVGEVKLKFVKTISEDNKHRLDIAFNNYISRTVLKQTNIKKNKENEKEDNNSDPSLLRKSDYDLPSLNPSINNLNLQQINKYQKAKNQAKKGELEREQQIEVAKKQFKELLRKIIRYLKGRLETELHLSLDNKERDLKKNQIDQETLQKNIEKLQKGLPIYISIIKKFPILIKKMKQQVQDLSPDNPKVGKLNEEIEELKDIASKLSIAFVQIFGIEIKTPLITEAA